jgi:hypothetical protein
MHRLDQFTNYHIAWFLLKSELYQFAITSKCYEYLT